MKNKQFLLFSVLLAWLAADCTATTDTKVGSGAVSSSTATTTGTVTPTTATLNESTGCVTNVNTAMDSSLPSWIKDNFKCQVAYVSGSTYVFKTIGIPNHKSYYYCSAQTKAAGCTGTKGPLYEDFTGTHNQSAPTTDNGTNYGAGTNIIATQNFVMNVPITPSVKTGTLTSTQAGQAIIGVTVNGVAIFNNAAGPGDTLQNQAFTFDNFGGHPDNSKIYHHHSEVTKVSPTMQTGALIGIMLDGYAVYDEFCDQNNGSAAFKPTAPTTTSNGTASAVSGDTTTTLDQLHGHTSTTKHFSTATYHYHYAQDPQAAADTTSGGYVITKPSPIKALVGSYFKGTSGTSSN